MADTRPPRVGFGQAARLCVFALFAPQRLAAADIVFEQSCKRLGAASPAAPHRKAEVINRAFWSASRFVAVAVVLGLVLGTALRATLGPLAPRLITALQVVGAALLLWGTVFVRGWEIQTLGGVTPSERVNQWLFRALYYAGTAAIIASLMIAPLGPQ